MNCEFWTLLPGERIRWIYLTAYSYRDETNQRLVPALLKTSPKAKCTPLPCSNTTLKKNSTLKILSRDLASPINTLQGLAASVAKRTQQYEDTRLKETLQLMQQTCQIGVELIRDFVAQEFLESSGVDLPKQRIDLVQKSGIVTDNY